MEGARALSQSNLDLTLCYTVLSFPSGATGKETVCQCRRHNWCGFDRWVRKVPWRRNGNPLQCSRLENPMDRGAWWATVHRVTKESDTTEETWHAACTHNILVYDPGLGFFEWLTLSELLRELNEIMDEEKNAWGMYLFQAGNTRLIQMGELKKVRCRDWLQRIRNQQRVLRLLP